MKSISILTVLSLMLCGCACNCGNEGADEQFGPNPGGEAKNQATPATPDKPGL